jgi:uncharacterized protein YcbK (DUF882 family)
VSYIPRHFKPAEFTCKCGCGFDGISEKLVFELDAVRDAMGVPIYVNCGCRCTKHNAEVGGKQHSYHLNGMAADITIRGMTPAVKTKLKNVLIQHFDGIIEYNTFFHVDVRGYRMWQFKEGDDV